MNIPVTQINLQHCKEASSTLNHFLTKSGVGLALIQEPWVYRKHIRGLNIRNGRIFYDTTCDIPRVCILVLGGVQARKLTQYTSRDVVTVQVTLQLGGDCRTVVFCSAYLPYDAEDLPPSRELVNLVDYTNRNNLPLVIGCDANAHNVCWGSSNTNQRGRALLEYLVTTNLSVLNRGTKPTFVVSNRQEVIDITLVTSSIESLMTGWRVSDEESLSDHRYIQFQVKADRPVLPSWRNPRATRWDAYCADLEAALGGRMTQIETTDDIEMELKALYSGIQTSFYKNCKERKHKYAKGALWWYPELNKMRKECRSNIRRARRNQIDGRTARDVRKKYKKVLRQCRRESWHRFCASVEGPRPAARLFKILSKDRTVDVDDISMPDGTYASNTGEILQFLMDTNFPGNTKLNNIQDNSSYRASTEDWQMAKKIVTEERVEWAISLFAPFKSPGLDEICPALLQKGLSIILSQLVTLFRACIALGYIPHQWRTARVVFLPKPGRIDYTQVKAFRPISLTSFFIKTVERLIDRYIRDGTLVRSPLNKNQHAYLAGKSTDTALHNLVSKIERALVNKEYALGIFLDIEGAFNNAPPSSIKSVLNAKGIGSTVIRWIDSMLSHRIARVTSGVTTLEVQLLRGFPQGGVLSALLWILIADGLLNTLNTAGYFAQGFADDFSVLVEGRDLRTVCEVAQAGINKIEKWCRGHKLSVNPGKTEMVLFTHKRKVDKFKPIRLFGKELSRSDQVKYLGVILDSKLTWKAHLESKYNKAVATFFQCRRIVGKTWGITPKIAHWIYIAIIRPMISYAAVVWWPRVELGVARDMLGRIQRLACLAITGAIRTTPTAAMEVLLGLQPLDIYMRSAAMCSCYRMKCTGTWRNGVKTGHTRMAEVMGSQIPISNMRGDSMPPKYSFGRNYSVSIQTRSNWQQGIDPPVPKGAISVFTDGSGETFGTGAGIFFNELSEDLSIPLGKFTSVFQAETFAILQCATILKTLDLGQREIYICSDSQAAIKALHKPKITSRLVWECREALTALSESHLVCLTWVPGHTGIQGNERADQLARQASSQTFVGPEPVLPIPYSMVKTAIRDWAYSLMDNRWQDLMGCRQAKEMIKNRTQGQGKELLGLPRQVLRLVVGVLTGHTQLNRHLCIMGVVTNPFCEQCDEAIESAMHYLCYCSSFSSIRRAIWGKDILYPADIEAISVRGLVRFIKESRRFSQSC